MNPTNKLSQAEAERLLDMLKYTLSKSINFPEKGKSNEFEIKGDSMRDLFVVKIYRGSVNRTKYNLGARIKKNGILLLELHINPGNVHENPDGVKITESHWHIYTEEHGRRMAYPAEDINSAEFVSNTLLFLKKFNVVEVPVVNAQLEIV